MANRRKITLKALNAIGDDLHEGALLEPSCFKQGFQYYAYYRDREALRKRLTAGDELSDFEKQRMALYAEHEGILRARWEAKIKDATEKIEKMALSEGDWRGIQASAEWALKLLTQADRREGNRSEETRSQLKQLLNEVADRVADEDG